MKLFKGISLSLLSGLLLGSGVLFLNNKNKIEPLIADTSTDMDAITPDNGEQLDKANMIYDDFSSGYNSSMWLVSRKAWGNDTPRNSGVIPDNVMYNSTNKTMVFRALGDYYDPNEGLVNYDLHHDAYDVYNPSLSSEENKGRVYSKDGTRTGGCIKTRNAYGPGRFEARFKAAPIEGVCTAFWTYNYGNHGEDNYNEIDFELPTYSDDSTEETKNDLSFDHVIYTTYKTEKKYKSQHLAAPTYLNDGKFHTYCIDWYYSNNTKKVKWYIDGQLVASCSDSNSISNNVGRVTLGLWVPSRSSFCGLPNFDKAYMELDYFKYTPFKNQTYTTVVDGLNTKHYREACATITNTPEDDFMPNGSFTSGLPSHFITHGDVEASKSYNYSGANSYGIKTGGQGNSGLHYLKYVVPNVKGISKLKLSMKYKGEGWVETYSGEDPAYTSSGLSSANWEDLEGELTLTPANKTLTLYFCTESPDDGFIIDDIKLNFVEETPTPPDPGDGLASYSFFTKNNGQTTDNTKIERTIYPDGDNDHPWKMACGYLETGSKDTFNTIQVKPNTNVMSSESGGYYYPFKTCLLDNEVTSSDKIALLAMEFDVSNLTDLELVLYSFSDVSNRKLFVLYSLNEGTSWNLLTTKTMKSSDKNTSDDNFRFDYKFTIPNELKNQTIRFAFAGTAGGSGGEDSGYVYRYSGIIINNFQNFKDKLDGATCDLDTDSQAFLAHQYANLSASELTLLSSTQMKYYEQSYAEGYNYLLAYWASNSNESREISAAKKNSVIIIAVISAAIMSSILGAYFLIKRKRFNR